MVACRTRARSCRRRVAAARCAALAARPAVVDALAGAGRRVDQSISSHAPLADVADQQVAGRAVEAEAPRVAQAVRPDALPNGLPARPRRSGVDPQDLAELRVRVCALCRRVAAVAGARRTARRRARTGAGRRCGWSPGVRDRRAARGWRRVGHVRVAPSAGTRAPRASPPSVRGQEDVEAAARGVVGREGDREQAALARRRSCRPVTSRNVPPPTIFTRPPCSTTNTRGSLGRRGDVHRRREVADLDQRGRRGCRRGGQQHEGDAEQQRRASVGRHVSVVGLERQSALRPRRPGRRPSSRRRSRRAGTRWPPSTSAIRRGSRRRPACRARSCRPARRRAGARCGGRPRHARPPTRSPRARRSAGSLPPRGAPRTHSGATSTSAMRDHGTSVRRVAAWVNWSRTQRCEPAAIERPALARGARGGARARRPGRCGSRAPGTRSPAPC